MKTVYVEDLMTTKVLTTSASRTIDDFIKTVEEKSFSGMPVVDDKGKAIGLISQNDVIKGMACLQQEDKLPPNFQERKKRLVTHLLNGKRCSFLQKRNSRSGGL